jgi:signal transduction histidine kinase
MGRVEPVRATVDIGALVTEVMDAQAFAAPKVEVRVDVGEELPACSADADLVRRALENVVQNAVEAMPDGGILTVRARAASGPAGVVLSVADEGGGLDARTRERAFDEFFTTKAGGSGLGLGFVRRVVEAHGGTVALAGREGRGTVVELTLPAAREVATRTSGS